MTRIVFVATEDWSIITYRLPVLRAARDAGYEIHVITRVDRHRQAIEAEGAVVHPIDFRRGSSRPDYLARTVVSVRRLYKEIRPDIVHSFAVQAVIVATLATTGLELRVVNSVTGLGTVFTSARGIVPQVIAMLLPRLLARPLTSAVVQNQDDVDFLRLLGVPERNIDLVAGSGVDVDVLLPMSEPLGEPTIAYVGRMLEDKGVRTLVEAHRILRRAGKAPRLLLAGTTDPLNPSSIPEGQVRSWGEEPGVIWLGHVENIAEVWRAAHIAVLPSRREGLPKSLLEAAACGRPLIASDVPGCRAAVRSGANGLLYPFGDANALAAAIVRLVDDPELRRRYGEESRRRAIEEFSSARIGREIVGIYERLLRSSSGSGAMRQRLG
ncbi:glycosyltransferase family 4 protein [Rhodopseudomonas palustris]|uniref:glycosyltransferase family 4 protein n=1 Tax=Rhodopseudomonas palustris TaxID=1076 RepID=UPI00131C8954|nr:glycosyltransferase family 4 protein [Rhodopseudomonas palustris]